MILGIETSTALCSVALFDDDGVHHIKEDEGPQSHSALLTLMIEEVLQEAGMSMEDLKGVFFSDGPGSYTGLRIGASVAKSICYVKDIPMYACSSLQACALASMNEDKGAHVYVGLMDARREDVYALALDKSGKVIQPAHLGTIPTDLIPYLESLDKKVALCGSGRTKVSAYPLPEHIILSEIGHSAAHLQAAWCHRGELSFEKPFLAFEPYYMQRPNITRPKRLWFTKS